MEEASHPLFSYPHLGLPTYTLNPKPAPTFYSSCLLISLASEEAYYNVSCPPPCFPPLLKVPSAVPKSLSLALFLSPLPPQPAQVSPPQSSQPPPYPLNPRRSVPTTGTIRRVLDDAMPSSLKHLDGTFRVVHASADTDVVACAGTVATAPTSAESRDALRIYHAAIHDLTTPAEDIAAAFLTSSVASMRPSAKPIPIAPTSSPTLLARVPPTTISPTRTDSHSQCSNNATKTSHLRF